MTKKIYVIARSLIFISTTKQNGRLVFIYRHFLGGAIYILQTLCLGRKKSGSKCSSRSLYVKIFQSKKWNDSEDNSVLLILGLSSNTTLPLKENKFVFFFVRLVFFFTFCKSYSCTIKYFHKILEQKMSTFRSTFKKELVQTNRENNFILVKEN